jgi:hypothetical protein
MEEHQPGQDPDGTEPAGGSPLDEETMLLATLYLEHTASQPNLPYPEVVSELGLQAEAARLLSWEQFSRQAGADAALQDRALDFLNYYLTPLRLELEGGGAQDKVLELVWGILMAMDDDHHRRFLAETLFNLADPAEVNRLKTAIWDAFPPKAVAAALVDHLSADNPLHHYNALHLPYHLFGWNEQFALSSQDRQEILAAVEELKEREDLHPLVSVSLEGFGLPDTP